MKIKNIDRWMLLLLAVLLTACHSDNMEEIASPDEECYLDIYVYAPDRPIVTRSDVGDIAERTKAESEVKTLQIWVFKHADGNKVGYLGAGTGDASDVPNPLFLNETGQQIYRMKVSKTFADNPEAVDVYVVANAASCGLTFSENTKRSELDEAVISSDYFGTSSLVSVVPENGLPMSTVVKNEPIFGSFPALRIGTETQMTTLRLTRAVSKLRFILCRITETDETAKKLESIDKITLNGNQIPTQSYLIPRESYDYTYDHPAINYQGIPEKSKIPDVTDPTVYVYETQKAKDYEDLINQHLIDLADVNETAVDEKLLELGLTYFRESDRRLTGEIKYTYSQSGVQQDQATATFTMANPGDFLRNHSWIVYIYYMDSEIYTLTVTHIGMRSWNDDPNSENPIVYNW